MSLHIDMKNFFHRKRMAFEQIPKDVKSMNVRKEDYGQREINHNQDLKVLLYLACLIKHQRASIAFNTVNIEKS